MRWNKSVSVQFSVGNDVRQGSCLSPAIFHVFNHFIVSLTSLRVCCHVKSLFIDCMLYADDMTYFSSSPIVAGLHLSNKKCSVIASYLSLSFNLNRSQ